MKERKEGRQEKARNEGWNESIPKNFWIFLLQGTRITFFAAIRIWSCHHSQNGHSQSFLLVFSLTARQIEKFVSGMGWGWGWGWGWSRLQRQFIKTWSSLLCDQ
jgi:hypothetical protein